jgi:hypothetical protein
VCFKPTATCLATQDTVDFLYACDAHLVDRGFATKVADEPAQPGMSADEIAQVKADWDARQQRKAEKAKEKPKGSEKAGADEDEKDAAKKSDGAGKGKGKGAVSPASTPTTPATPPVPTKPKHERYTLHRDIFALRKAEHRKRRQAEAAKKLAPQLPIAPRSLLPSS